MSVSAFVVGSILRSMEIFPLPTWVFDVGARGCADGASVLWDIYQIVGRQGQIHQATGGMHEAMKAGSAGLHRSFIGLARAARWV